MIKKAKFVQRKIDELYVKWYSTHCYLKRNKDEATNENEKHFLSLTSLDALDANELVAVYSSLSDIRPDAHYLRHSDTPTCYLDGNKVYTIDKVEQFTELTIKFYV